MQLLCLFSGVPSLRMRKTYHCYSGTRTRRMETLLLPAPCLRWIELNQTRPLKRSTYCVHDQKTAVYAKCLRKCNSITRGKLEYFFTFKSFIVELQLWKEHAPMPSATMSEDPRKAPGALPHMNRNMNLKCLVV